MKKYTMAVVHDDLPDSYVTVPYPFNPSKKFKIGDYDCIVTRAPDRHLLRRIWQQYEWFEKDIKRLEKWFTTKQYRDTFTKKVYTATEVTTGAKIVASHEFAEVPPLALSVVTRYCEKHGITTNEALRSRVERLKNKKLLSLADFLNHMENLS